MRNLLIFMFLVGFFVLGSRSCDGLHFVFGGVRGQGTVQTQTRSAANFHAIDLSLSADVEVRISDAYAVEVSAQENLLPLLKTEVMDGVLRVFSEKNLSSSMPIKIILSAPTFDQFSISGSGSIAVLDPLQSETMRMEISGSGDIACTQCDFRQLKTKISGSGDIALGGRANDVTVHIAGSGDLKAKNLRANTLSVNIAGSGTVTAEVEAELKADIAGSGDVYYSGSPSVETKVSGSGSVKRVGAE